MTRLTLKDETPLRLSVKGLIPERCAGLSLAEIARLPVTVGNRPTVVGDWFRIAAGNDATLEFDGPCERIDHLGANMSAGSMTVQGDAGAYVALGMCGGSITVNGSAGFGAASDLRGGTVRIGGNVGDWLGGALPGAAGGMRDGVVIVAGDAGDGAGARLRRGLIAICGAAGASCGAGMIAGTIVAGGKVGSYAGAAMRRGTIIALSGVERTGPGFVDCGIHDLVFLRLLARQLDGLGLSELARQLGPLRRCMGDAAVAGKGELLFAA
jgi:formylmethanofuran dehydrogenase subunit C